MLLQVLSLCKDSVQAQWRSQEIVNLLLSGEAVANGFGWWHVCEGETNVNLPADKLQNLCMEAVDTLYGVNSGRSCWSWTGDFFFGGGMKDPSGLMGKVSDLYHFNGIAKSVMNGKPGFIWK
ncbi:hypothetical protein BC332_29214 [Capsicum chinense]|nr:hypothetical protein BC332_29214 [Capsicum chinense]